MFSVISIVPYLSYFKKKQSEDLLLVTDINQIHIYSPGMFLKYDG